MANHGRTDLRFMDLEPRDFQRCALDLLRLEFGGLIPVDLPYGHTDGGYDGILYTATIGGWTGPWGVDAKRVEGKDAAKQLADYRKRYPERAVLLVVAGKLTKKQRDALVAKGTPSAPVAVRDGAELGMRARSAPWLAAWYFPADTPPYLRPVEEGPPDGVMEGHLLPVEHAARDLVAAALREGKVVLLHGGARVRPGLVAHEAMRAFGAGGWWLGETAVPGDARVLRLGLGEERPRTAVILREDAAKSLAGSKDLNDVPMLVLVDESNVDAWRRRLNKRAHEVVGIERPKLSEILAWAQKLGVPDPWGAVMRVTQPDRIEAGVGASPGDLQVVAQALIDEVPEAALRAALLVAMETPLKFVIVARNFGGEPISREALDAWSWDHDVDAAVKAGLLEPVRGGMVLVSPFIGIAAGEALRLTQRSAVVDTIVARARSGNGDALSWWVAGPEPTGLVPAEGLPVLRADWDAVVAEALEQLTEQERIDLLARSQEGRPFWAVSEQWARWGLNVVQAGIRSGDPNLCAVAATLAPRCALAANAWPTLATSAVELLVLAVAVGVTGLRSADQIEGALAPLTSPAQLKPGVAADVMEALAAAVREGPSGALVQVASAALKPWLRDRYRVEQLEGSISAERIYVLPAEGQWARAHPSARGLLLALLDSDHPAAFAQGLLRLRNTEVVLDRPTSDHATAALAVLQRKSDTDLPAAARALLLEACEEFAIRAPTKDLARAFLAPWRADVETLLLRNTLLALRFPEDLSDALAAIEADDHRQLRRALQPFADASAIVERLANRWWDGIPAKDSAAGLHALLNGIDQGVRWFREAGVSMIFRSDALLALAAQRPEPFDAMLEGPAWKTVPDSLRPLVALVLVHNRRQAIAEAVEGRRGSGGFLTELLSFLAAPERFDTERGTAWLGVVAQVTPPPAAPAMLHRLAHRVPAALRPVLAGWFANMLFGRQPLDPRDGEAIARALSAAEDGWSLLVQDVARGELEGLAVRYPWLRSAVVDVALRRFSGLAVEGPTLDVQLTDAALASAWVAAEHPERWWHLRQLVFFPKALHQAGLTGSLALVLMETLPRSLHSALVPWADMSMEGPVLSVNRTPFRTVFQHVVAATTHHDPSWLSAQIGDLPPADDLRVALLLEGVPHLDPLVETSRALDEVHSDWFMGSVCSGLGVTGQRIGPARFLTGLEADDLNVPHPLTELAEEIEQRAAAEGGRIGDQLRAIAAQVTGRYDAKELRELVDRCNRLIRERTHADLP